MSRIDGTALGLVFIGGVLGYAGIKGVSVGGAVQAIVKGKSPAAAPLANQITGTNPGGSPGTSAAPGSGPGSPVTGAGYVGPRQTYLALRKAGFSSTAAVTMTAIAGVESTWHTTALNNTPATGDLSVGLFQINYYDGLNATRSALFGPWQQLLAADAQTQANAAFTLYQQSAQSTGNGFGPWQPDITSGKISQYMAQALAAAAAGG